MVTEKMIEAAQKVLDASFQKDYWISGPPEDATKRALESALSTDAEPVAWKGVGSDGVSELTDRQDIADQWRADGIEVTPLYAAPPQPAPSVAVKALTLDALKHYFECLNAGDFSWSEMPTSLYTYLLMDGYVSNESARHEVRAALSAQVQDVAVPEGWQLVPKELTPELRKRLQMHTEMGAYVCENLSGAYGLMDEYHATMLAAVFAAAPAAKLEGKP